MVIHFLATCRGFGSEGPVASEAVEGAAVVVMVVVWDAKHGRLMEKLKCKRWWW